MKNKSFITQIWKLSFLGLGLLAAPAFASDSVVDTDSRIEVELPISHTYIAELGFDDNDNVQAVIEGYLPNSCYTLTQSDVVISTDSKVIKLRQKASRSTQGICENDTSLPPDLAAQRYFWKVLDIGLLNQGTYTLSYKGAQGPTSRTFGVDLAPTEQVDNMDYVRATNVFASKDVPTSQGEMEFRITGELTSTCAELGEDYTIEKVNDVYVVLLHTHRTEDFCMPASRGFYKVVRVKTPEAGRYLLHVRSIGGESKNKIFNIVDAL